MATEQPQPGRASPVRQSLDPPWNIAASGLAAILTLAAVGWSLGVPRMVGLAFYPAQFLAVMLAIALGIAFLVLPARRGALRAAPPWYDQIASAAGLGSGLWIAYRYPNLVDLVLLRPPEAVYTGVVIIALTLEALRRATGWPLVIIVGAFALYGLFGDMFPGRLSGRAQDWERLAAYLALDVNGMLGIPLGVAATIVVAFIFFGTLLGVTGGSRFFTEAALLGMGRFRGGSVKIAVTASGLFGSISGSAVANVVATGVITIPMIKRSGYPAHKAAAIEAVSSTGGQLLPPVMGAAAFLMAEFLAVPYSSVVLAALLPGILYYVALFIQADLEAARLGLTRVDPSEMPAALPVLWGLYFIAPFAALIVALFRYNWQPELAALLATGVLVVAAAFFGYQGRRPQIGDLLHAFVRTGYAVLDIILISAAAGIVIGVLNITGLSFNLTWSLVQLGAGSAIVLLLLSAVVCIVLGMGLPTLGVYVILAALVAPALVAVGIEPMAAHLYVLYFGMMSMITPPVAIAAFAAAGIAGSEPMRTGFAAMRFGWMAYVIPFLFVASPSLLMMGEPHAIVLAAITAMMGVWLVSIAVIGYFVRAIPAQLRALFALSGLMALVPAGAFPAALYTDIAGAVIGGLLILREVVIARGESRPIPREIPGE